MPMLGTPRRTAQETNQEELAALVPAQSVSREVKVGVFVLLGVIAFFAALFAFTDVGTFRARHYVTTVVEDAGGMRRGDPVQMRGVNIGRVTKFGIVPQGVEIRMEISNEYPVPEGSHAIVKSNGLLGGMVVDVVPAATRQTVRSGGSIRGSVEHGLMAEAAGIGTRADTMLTRINALLAPGTIENVGRSTSELQILLAELNRLAAQQRTELAALSSSLRRTATNVERATDGPELERTLANIDALTGRLDETSGALSRAGASLETVLARLERGEGTLGKLSTDESLYANLNLAATNLTQLVEDIRANPKRYLSVSVF